MASGKVSNANRIKMMEFMKSERQDEKGYTDKIRLLVISILCGNDMSDIK